jgi:hypothetical protein
MEQIGSLIMIPLEELEKLKNMQAEILLEIKALRGKHSSTLNNVPQYLTAKEFMLSVKICRTKFDKLVATKKIPVVKKRRKIYVHIQEVDRYFTDASIL